MALFQPCKATSEQMVPTEALIGWYGHEIDPMHQWTSLWHCREVWAIVATFAVHLLATAVYIECLTISHPSPNLLLFPPTPCYVHSEICAHQKKPAQNP